MMRKLKNGPRRCECVRVACACIRVCACGVCMRTCVHAYVFVLVYVKCEIISLADSSY